MDELIFICKILLALVPVAIWRIVVINLNIKKSIEGMRKSPSADEQNTESFSEDEFSKKEKKRTYLEAKAMSYKNNGLKARIAGVGCY